MSCSSRPAARHAHTVDRSAEIRRGIGQRAVEIEEDEFDRRHAGRRQATR